MKKVIFQMNQNLRMEIDYEGELIAILDELRKSRNKSKLLKEEIYKVKENKPSLVDNSLKTWLDELEKFKENLVQQILVQ